MSTSILFQHKKESNILYLKFLEKTQESLDNDVDSIVKWIKTQPHLPEVPSRNAIAFFLKANKCSIEKTKTNIDMYYTIRHVLPDVFENSHPGAADMQEIADKSYIITLPKLTQEGNVVTILRMKKPFTTKDYLRGFAYLFNVFEVRLAEEQSVRDILVFDSETQSLSSLMKVTPTVLKAIQILFTNVVSARVAKIILLNSPVPETLINILKRFLSKKLTERIVVLDDHEKLWQHIPKEMLPRNYGGDELSMDELKEIWKTKLEEYYPRFDKLREMRVKEELRPTPLNNDDILGYYGNFKKLDVD